MSATATPYLFQEELYRFTSPVAVIIPREWNTYSAEEQLLLKRILASVKVDINAVPILTRPAFDLQALNVYSPARVLLFGCELADIPLYEQKATQGFLVIRADDLSTLDEQKKKNLWTALRQMFGL